MPKIISKMKRKYEQKLHMKIANNTQYKPEQNATKNIV